VAAAVQADAPQVLLGRIGAHASNEQALAELEISPQPIDPRTTDGVVRIMDLAHSLLVWRLEREDTAKPAGDGARR